MLVFTVIIIVIISAVIGYILDISGTISHPSYFWALGMLFGFLAGVISES